MLNVSEKFYSIQGEGVSVGTPAYFIRLQGCNLMCGGPSGSLVKEGKATWWCDTEVIWKRGEPYLNEILEQEIAKECDMDKVINGQIHLVWTGGEPTIPRHQKAIIDFVDYLTDKHEVNKIYNEIETNGTIVVKEPRFYGYDTLPVPPTGEPRISPDRAEELLKKWLPVLDSKPISSLTDKEKLETAVLVESKERRYHVIDQINCSPKLANSGMSVSMRINPEAIKQICRHPNYWFKFVVSREDDLLEIEDTYVNDLEIDPTRVILMPGCDNAVDLPERTRFIFEMAKKYGYRAVTRQHILAWNKTIGV